MQSYQPVMSYRSRPKFCHVPSMRICEWLQQITHFIFLCTLITMLMSPPQFWNCGSNPAAVCVKYFDSCVTVSIYTRTNAYDVHSHGYKYGFLLGLNLNSSSVLPTQYTTLESRLTAYYLQHLLTKHSSTAVHVQLLTYTAVYSHLTRFSYIHGNSLYIQLIC
jgi:hypothetical protein